MSQGGPDRKKSRFRTRAETGFGVVVCLLIFALLLVGKAKPQAQTQTKPPTSPQSILRIATWNLRDCAARNPVTKAEILLHDDIARFLAEAMTDIVVFEEVQVDTARGGDIGKLSDALARVGWPMPYIATVNTRGEDDIAIFSRYEILNHEPVLVPTTTDTWPRAGLSASISVSGEVLQIYGFHFKAMGDIDSENARKSQAKALMALIESKFEADLNTANMVLAGDFNTANPSDFGESGSTLSILSMKDDENPQNDFISSNYSYMQNHPTFADSRYSSILDHIFLSPNLGKRLKEGKVYVIPPERRNDEIPVSDHAMVLVELPLPL